MRRLKQLTRRGFVKGLGAILPLAGLSSRAGAHDGTHELEVARTQMVNQQVAVWDNLGVEVACAGPFAGQGELTVLPTGMNIGNWYYISVDDDGTPGTFTLCVDDTIDYDYPEGAFEITDPVNWCSPDIVVREKSRCFEDLAVNANSPPRRSGEKCQLAIRLAARLIQWSAVSVK